MTDVSPLYCYKHPERETMLRCSRCERPICSECAVLTPTGYRCRDCIRGQQKIFDTARSTDYVLAFVIAGALSFLGSLIATRLGFFIIFLAPLAGVIIAEAVRWAVQKRRSKSLFIVATTAAGLGALPQLLFALLPLLLGGNVGGLLGLIWPAVYAFFVVTTTYYRLSGIELRR